MRACDTFPKFVPFGKCHRIIWFCFSLLPRSHEEYAGAFRQYMAVYREYCDNSLKAGQDVRAMLEGLKAENPDWRGLFLLAVACIGRMQHDEATVRMIRERFRSRVRWSSLVSMAIR